MSKLWTLFWLVEHINHAYPNFDKKAYCLGCHVSPHENTIKSQSMGICKALRSQNHAVIVVQFRHSMSYSLYKRDINRSMRTHLEYLFLFPHLVKILSVHSFQLKGAHYPFLYLHLLCKFINSCWYLYYYCWDFVLKLLWSCIKYIEESFNSPWFPFVGHKFLSYAIFPSKYSPFK